MQFFILTQASEKLFTVRKYDYHGDRPVADNQVYAQGGDMMEVVNNLQRKFGKSIRRVERMSDTPIIECWCENDL